MFVCCEDVKTIRISIYQTQVRHISGRQSVSPLPTMVGGGGVQGAHDSRGMLARDPHKRGEGRGSTHGPQQAGPSVLPINQRNIQGQHNGPRRSWVNVVGGQKAMNPYESIIAPGPMLEKLKASVKDTVWLDDAMVERAQQPMKLALYGKLFGRTPPFEVVRESLSRIWDGLGEFTVADLPNGFYLIRCESELMMENLLAEGPWTISGMILHLMRWRPNFQPAFEKMTTVTLWLQLHNLPSEYWELETLESVVLSFGRLVKVDETTQEGGRGRFARVCVELDLGRPLRSGVWVNTSKAQMFVSALYEKIPQFCYSCGMIGHVANLCMAKLPGSRSEAPGPAPPPPDPKGKGKLVDETMQLERNTTGTQLEPQTDMAVEGGENSGPSYGPWMDARWKSRGRGVAAGGRGGGRMGRRPLERELGPSEHVLHDRSAQMVYDSHVNRHDQFLERGSRGKGRGSRASHSCDMLSGKSGPSQIGKDGDTGYEANDKTQTHPKAPIRTRMDQTKAQDGLKEPRNGKVDMPDLELSNQFTGFIYGDEGQTMGSASKEKNKDDGSTSMNVDFKGKAKHKPCSSTPLLLMSASNQRAESSSDAHRLLVERVEQALGANKEPSEPQSDSDNLEEDSVLDDSADERTLWEIHKSTQKGSRDRKGVQVLSAVQKKKIQKKKGKGKAGGKGSKPFGPC